MGTSLQRDHSPPPVDHSSLREIHVQKGLPGYEDHQQLIQGMISGHQDHRLIHSPRRAQRSLSPPRPAKGPEDHLASKVHRDPSPAGTKAYRDPSPARATEYSHRVFETPLLSVVGL